MPVIRIDTDDPILPDVPTTDEAIGVRIRELANMMKDLKAISEFREKQLKQGRQDLALFLGVFGIGFTP